MSQNSLDPVTVTRTDTPHDDPELIREDIARTRAELGDTVEALGAKTDLKGRASHAVREKGSALAETAKEKGSTLAETAKEKGGALAESARTSPQLGRARQRGRRLVDEHPVALTTALVGLLLLMVKRRRDR